VIDQPILYARPYRGSQQHMVRSAYDQESRRYKLSALCGLEPKKGWTSEYSGYGGHSETWSEPFDMYPVCRACTTRHVSETQVATP
jgi:hypothetical protein